MFKSFKAVAGLALVAASLYATSASAFVTEVPGLLELSVLEPNVVLDLKLFPDQSFVPLISATLFGEQAIGINVGSAVPEPETFAMMGLGLGLVALAARRRRNAQ